MSRRPLARHTAIAASSLLACAAGAHAASAYPDRPVRMIVPFTPGGGTDLVARMIAQKLGENLGQPVVVENKAGAGGTLAVSDVARATPDGYRILIHHIGMSTAPALYRKLSFDPLRNTFNLATHLPRQILKILRHHDLGIEARRQVSTLNILR